MILSEMSQDKVTAGQGHFFVLGQGDNGTSRLVEMLLFSKQIGCRCLFECSSFLLLTLGFLASRREFLDPARYSGLLISDPRISKIRIIKKFLSKSRDEWLSRDEKFCILTQLIDYLHFKCSVPILFLDSILVSLCC